MGDVGSGKKKIMKTYGSKTTLDDLGLRSSGNQVGWEASPTKRRKITNDEEGTIVVSSPSEDRKKELTAAKARIVEGKPVSQQEVLRADADGSTTKCCTHGKANAMSGDSTVQQRKDHRASAQTKTSHPQRRSSIYTDGDKSDSQAVAIRREKEVYSGSFPPVDTTQNEKSHTAVSAQESMLPPTIAVAPTFPPIGSMQEKEHLIDVDEAEDFMLYSNPETNGQHSELSSHELAESRILWDVKSNHRQVQENQPPSRTKLQSPKSSINDHDELSLPTSRQFEDTTSLQASKVKFKRKKEDLDELGSDELDVGLPKENYQPRPSRSRSNRTADDFLLAIDLSKRPGSLQKVKKRNKRRKTMGDEVTVLEDCERSTFNSIEVCIPQGGNDHIQLGGKQQRTVEGTSEIVAKAVKPTRIGESGAILDIAVDSKEPHLEEAEVTADTVSPLAAILEPKKRRGRPKKQTTEQMDHVDVNTALGEHSTTAIDTPDDPNDEQALPSQKSRKRNAQEGSPITEHVNASADHLEDTDLSLSKRAFSEIQDRANLPVPSPKIMETCKEVKDATTSPVQTVLLETPQKQGKNDTGRHSPINSGKVPHRVGLSKRARIEPLLRVVKK